MPAATAFLLLPSKNANTGWMVCSCRRLYAESAPLLLQEPSIHVWKVVVITPTRQLNFGASETGPNSWMAGLTVDDFTQSVAYREIFGLGEAQEAARVTLRLLTRRCGPLTDATTAQIQALQIDPLEALADALLDFQGPADLAAWLAAHTTNA